MEESVFGAAEQLMAKQMAHYDCSHDMLHVRRVRKLAEKIGRTLNVDMAVVTLGAIFHDAVDHKYAATHGVAVEERVDEIVKLLSQYGLPARQIDEVVRVMQNVGYSKEKKLRAATKWSDWHENSQEFHCVQDADRLDAMGAIGMMRCAAYSCVINQPLYSQSGSAYDHIEDKLLLLRDTLQTPVAQDLGEKRHQFLVQFKRQLELENEMLS